MTKLKIIFLWVGLLGSLPATGFTGLSIVLYARLSAVAPERWPPDKAGLWTYSALALMVLFVCLFIYCLVSLIKESNRR